MKRQWLLFTGDALNTLQRMPNRCVHTCITSPPYYKLRDYNMDGQIGLEATLDEYVAKLVTVFRQVKRVLHDEGTLWLVMGDSYAGSWGAQSRSATANGTSTLTGSPLSGRQIMAHPRGTKTGTIPDGAPFKAKDLFGLPWMVALALRADGWYLRSEVIWSKPNPMPESVRDRPTKAHESVFLLAKAPRYYYNATAIRTVSKKKGHSANRRSVWTVATSRYQGAHFSTFPPKLIEPMIQSCCPRHGLVLDPFAGSGTTLQVAVELNRLGVGIELNPQYVSLARKRLHCATS
jgi:DNA modification methylase